MLIDEPRTIDESYSSAVTTSNLRIPTERKGDSERRVPGDLVVAAGMNKSRIGGALLRLHTEFDSSEKTRLATAAQFLPAGKTTKEQRNHAAKQAHAFNLHESGILLGKLKALPEVRREVTLQAVAWGMSDPALKAVAVLHWWLHKRCPVCHGTKFQVAEGTGRQTGKACQECKGTGERDMPYNKRDDGGDGERLVNFLNDCVTSARDSIGKRLRSGYTPVRAAPVVRPDARVHVRAPK